MIYQYDVCYSDYDSRGVSSSLLIIICVGGRVAEESFPFLTFPTVMSAKVSWFLVIALTTIRIAPSGQLNI